MNYWLIKSPFNTRSWQDVQMSSKFSLYVAYETTKRGETALKKISAKIKQLNKCYKD